MTAQQRSDRDEQNALRRYLTRRALAQAVEESARRVQAGRRLELALAHEPNR